MAIKAYGAQVSDQPLASMDITRRAPGAHDVQIDIAYCGVCHSDSLWDEKKTPFYSPQWGRKKPPGDSTGLSCVGLRFALLQPPT
jgi:NADPH:quinone reductase-like Zn-dependent oxidoreductase